MPAVTPQNTTVSNTCSIHDEDFSANPLFSALNPSVRVRCECGRITDVDPALGTSPWARRLLAATASSASHCQL